MPGPKTNEREGTRAVLRNTRTSAFKIRPVLDLVRNKPIGEARDILRFCERDAADLVGKLLDSAIANAEHNDGLVAEELFVSAAYADEGRTYKGFRPRARGRAGHLRKRSAHITVIVSRLPEDRLGVVKARAERNEANRRARRVAGSQGRAPRAAAPVEETVVEDTLVEETPVLDEPIESVEAAEPIEAVDIEETTAEDTEATEQEGAE